TPWPHTAIAEPNVSQSPIVALTYTTFTDVNGLSHCAVVLGLKIEQTDSCTTADCGRRNTFCEAY
ncbi:MAG: hypothetical protein ACRC2T_14025, partial [Thermoguttaceae bacterium]